MASITFLVCFILLLLGLGLFLDKYLPEQHVRYSLDCGCLRCRATREYYDLGPADRDQLVLDQATYYREDFR